MVELGMVDTYNIYYNPDIALSETEIIIIQVQKGSIMHTILKRLK